MCLAHPSGGGDAGAFLAGLSLLVGFFVFQGVFWPAWWALLLAFAPWSLIDRFTAASTGPRTSVRGAIPALPAAIVVAVVLLQLIVSAMRVESEPFVSDYSMYAYTWSSREAFDEYLAGKSARYEMAPAGVGAEEFDSQLSQMLRAFDVLIEAFSLAARGESWPDATRDSVAAVRADYQARFDSPLSQIEVREYQGAFDWNVGTFDEEGSLALHGVLELDAGRFIPMTEADSGP